jgi:hypothetical protein
MANLASAGADADHPAAPAAEADSFVLNLCSSTTPMALAQTELPELKRFTFFVSRRFEEGRERFRLHMGFFANLAEAEEWLAVVREIYPGAWAGEAPGRKLRARAAEAAATQARHAVGPQKTAVPAAAPAVAPVPAPAAAAPVAKPVSAPPAAPPKLPKLVPTLHPPAPAAAVGALPTATSRPVAAQTVKVAPQAQPKRPLAAAPAPRAAPVPRAAAAPAARATLPHATAPQSMPAARSPTTASLPSQPRSAATASPSPQPRTAAAPAGVQRPPVKPMPGRPAAQAGATASAASAKPAAAAAARSAPPAASAGLAAPTKKPIFADSNVREVLAALDTAEDATGETRLMHAPAITGDTADDSSLTDTQVLRFLETRRVDDGAARAFAAPQVDAAAESGISLLKPDDTGTRRALKEAVSHNEPVSFAVQLQWSVQPVELDKVPPLAIFSAYTLYSVEGSREGRRWYGLRLGFFTDAISAKQVAYYVRSEFTSVAVVPVSPQERERATEDNQRLAGVGAPRRRPRNEDHGIKLIDSDETPRAAQAAPVASPPPPPASAPQASPARGGRKGGSKVGARERRTPQTLEETLEILGANELAIDNGRGDTLNDTGVRHLRVEVQKNTPFSRLLERLSERVKKA